MDRVSVQFKLSPQERAAFLRAARLKGGTMQSVLAAYSAGFERRVRRALQEGKIAF